MSGPVNELLPLTWDSGFLGFGVARLSAHALSPAALAVLVAQARAAGMRLLYVVAAPADARSNASALQAGAWLADRKVVFAQTVEPEAATLAIIPAIQTVTAPGPALESLALQSGEYSRFRRDRNFAPGVFSRMYQHWLHRSLAGELAQEVLAATGEPEESAATAYCGLLTLDADAHCATIGLLAVAEAARRQHIGLALVAAARQRTAAWGLGELRVATQLDNAPACAFYHHCGFQQARVEHIYHLWL